MQDINYPLQKAYTLALTGITYGAVSVPAYFRQLPDDINPDNYIIFAPANNDDTSTKNGYDTDSLMQVTIHTHKPKYNEGKACAAISGTVLTRLYVNKLVVPGFNVISTKLDSDTPTDFAVKNERVYVDRRLVFRHSIYQNNS